MKYEDIALTEVLEFWFEELGGEVDWFGGGEALDVRIRERFATTHHAVAAGEYWKHRTTPHSYLAEVIVLDQFSRQMFRGQAAAFAWDGMALTLAQHAVAAGFDTKFTEEERLFLYLPFMHSESRVIQTEAVQLFAALGNEKAQEMAKTHQDIIERFGRYPHRNEQLGRESTPAEADYLRENDEEFFVS